MSINLPDILVSLIQFPNCNFFAVLQPIQKIVCHPTNNHRMSVLSESESILQILHLIKIRINQ